MSARQVSLLCVSFIYKLGVVALPTRVPHNRNQMNAKEENTCIIGFERAMCTMLPPLNRMKAAREIM